MSLNESILSVYMESLLSHELSEPELPLKVERPRRKMNSVDDIVVSINDHTDDTIILLKTWKLMAHEMAKNLRKIHSSSKYYQEFIEISSCFLKYLDDIVRINGNLKLMLASAREKKERQKHLIASLRANRSRRRAIKAAAASSSSSSVCATPPPFPLQLNAVGNGSEEKDTDSEGPSSSDYSEDEDIVDAPELNSDDEHLGEAFGISLTVKKFVVNSNIVSEEASTSASCAPALPEEAATSVLAEEVTTSAPAEEVTTSTPAKEAAASVEQISTFGSSSALLPFEQTTTYGDQTSAPAKETTAAEQTYAPDEEPVAPSQQISAPSQQSCAPGKGPLVFEEQISAFAEEAISFAEQISAPAKQLFASAEDTFTEVASISAKEATARIKKASAHAEGSLCSAEQISASSKEDFSGAASAYTEKASAFIGEASSAHIEDFECNILDRVKLLPAVSFNDKLFEIKPINVSRRSGEQYNIVMEHIVSPSEFYVFLVQTQFIYLKLERQLEMTEKDTKFHKCRKTKDNYSKIIGKYALFHSRCEGKWCRAKITDWRLEYNDDLVYIFLIDSGESKCVYIEDLQPMPDSVKQYPAFIQRCHLSKILPTDMEEGARVLEWSKQAIEQMKCFIDESVKLKIRIEPEDVYHPFRSLPVTLWCYDQEEFCINELMVVADRAVSKTEDFTQATDFEKWNPMREDYNSYLNSYEVDMNDPAAVIYGYVGKDFDRICRHFAKSGKCFKGDSCKKEHCRWDPTGFTTDQEEIYRSAVNAYSVPPPRSIISVQVTCILGVNIFCCIRDELSCSTNEESLKTLVDYMNQSQNIREMQKLVIPPSVGQVVIARYSVDDAWYRGQIIESQPESDIYSVLFVDYGNSEDMPLSRIRAIEARYLHLPFQALRCYIYGIKQNPRAPHRSCIIYLNKRMTEGSITVEVIAAFPGDHTQLLVRAFDQNGRNIGEDLVLGKYALPKEELIVSAESPIIPG